MTPLNRGAAAPETPPQAAVVPPAAQETSQGPDASRGTGTFGTFVAGAVVNTRRAWSYTTAGTMALPPHLRWVGLTVAGQAHCVNRQRVPAVARDKPLDVDNREEAEELALERAGAYGPFVGTLWAHTYAMELAKQGKGPLPRFTALVESPLKKLAGWIGGRAGAAVGAYQLGFVIPRATAQLTASATGAACAWWYIVHITGAKLHATTPQERASGGSLSPEAHAAAGVAFAIPVLAATPRGLMVTRRLMGRFAPYFGAFAVPTACVVADLGVAKGTLAAKRRRAALAQA